jgi:transposase
MASRGYRSCRTYTDEVRQSAVAMVAAGQPISAVAATLAIPRRSLVNWVKRASGEASAPAPPSEKPTYDALEAEVRALRAEVAQLTEDNDLLGKASAYFARHAQTRRS